MTAITKERIAELANFKPSGSNSVNSASREEWQELARIALASLEAEPVGEIVLGEYDDSGCHPDAKVVCIADDGQADWENFKDGTRLYAVHPSRAAIDERVAFNAWNNDENLPIDGAGAKNAAWLAWQARAAMLQGAEPEIHGDELPVVVLHMGQAMSVFEALKKELLSEHVRNAELGVMGAVNVQVWKSVIGVMLQYEVSNGGCTLRVMPAAQQEA